MGDSTNQVSLPIRPHSLQLHRAKLIKHLPPPTSLGTNTLECGFLNSCGLVRPWNCSTDFWVAFHFPYLTFWSFDSDSFQWVRSYPLSYVISAWSHCERSTGDLGCSVTNMQMITHLNISFPIVLISSLPINRSKVNSLSADWLVRPGVLPPAFTYVLRPASPADGFYLVLVAPNSGKPLIWVTEILSTKKKFTQREKH